MHDIQNGGFLALTDLEGETVILRTSELLAYEAHTGFTRLRLLGRKVVDVKEDTQEIDRLVRQGASASLNSATHAPTHQLYPIKRDEPSKAAA